MSTKNMPEDVWVLDEGDFVKDTLHSATGEKHCLLGWADTMFPGGGLVSNVPGFISLTKKAKYEKGSAEWLLQQLLRAEWEIAKEEGHDAVLRKYVKGDLTGCPTGGTQHSIAGFNDTRGIPKKTLARIFNRFTAKLGYVEGNPEA